MIENMNIYVFDMGRVITRPSKLNQMYSKAGMSCGYMNFKNLFYHSKETDDVYKGFITDDEFFDYIRIAGGSNKTVSELKSLYTLSKGGIYLDTMQLIRKLKGTGNIVCLLSNLKKIDYDYLRENVDLSLFDRLFLSYQMGMSKPHDDIYKHVIQELGTNNFHFFDDTYENILAAKKFGIIAHQTTGEQIVKCFRRI